MTYTATCKYVDDSLNPVLTKVRQTQKEYLVYVQSQEDELWRLVKIITY